MKKILFQTSNTPVAIYPTQRGVKGLVTVKADKSGGSNPSHKFNVAIMAVQGTNEPNVQLTANLNNEAYYTLFGNKMTTFVVTCVDLPGVCKGGKGGSIARLHDAVDLMKSAINKGRLPTMKVTYASLGVTKTVTIKGYLTNITFTVQERMRGFITLYIQGYVS